MYTIEWKGDVFGWQEISRHDSEVEAQERLAVLKSSFLGYQLRIREEKREPELVQREDAYHASDQMLGGAALRPDFFERTWYAFSQFMDDLEKGDFGRE